MSFTIAVAGKGGVGKTTLSGLVVRYLVENGKTPVLAVDADPNSNLNEVLGLELPETLGEAREDMKKGQSQGMTKDLFIEMRVNQCLIESSGYDLIAMGRGEGAGCYCAANHLLTDCLDKLAANYKYLVVDNEAGLEHISRMTTQKADLFFFVSDPSRRSLTAAQRAYELAQQLKIINGPAYLVVTMVQGEPDQSLLDDVAATGLELGAWLPDDPELAACDRQGKPTSQLPAANPVVLGVFSMMKKILP